MVAVVVPVCFKPGAMKQEGALWSMVACSYFVPFKKKGEVIRISQISLYSACSWAWWLYLCDSSTLFVFFSPLCLQTLSMLILHCLILYVKVTFSACTRRVPLVSSMCDVFRSTEGSDQRNRAFSYVEWLRVVQWGKQGVLEAIEAALRAVLPRFLWSCGLEGKKQISNQP